MKNLSCFFLYHYDIKIIKTNYRVEKHPIQVPYLLYMTFNMSVKLLYSEYKWVKLD